MINTSMLQEALQSFVSGTDDVQGASLVSPDGLALTSVLSGNMDDERTAAMSASLLSLGDRIGRELARGNVERIVVEAEKGYGILVDCGADAVDFLQKSNNNPPRKQGEARKILSPPRERFRELMLIGLVLLVLASSATKQGLLFLEIKQAISRIAPLLA